MPTSVLIADSDQVTANWLRSILERAGFAVDTASSSSVAMQKIAHELPDFLVLDVVLSDGNGLDFVRRLRQDPNARALHIIILTSKGSPEDVASGMGAGADDYILKRPSADVELIGKIQALTVVSKKVAPEIPVGRGEILSFLSAKGGTGTTSVLINTAYALARQEPNAEILAVDMVFPMGTVGMSLGFESHRTVVKLSHEPQIDHITIEKYASSKTKWGFRILVGANDPQEGADLAVNQIVPLFETLKTMYDYILVDFGRALSRISLPVIELSERIVIILTPDISTVKGTRIFLQYLKSRDIPLDRVFIINNRTVGRVWTTTEDIERELSQKLNAMIPYTVEYMTMAINAAVPFMERFPENAASAAFMDIARRLHPTASAKGN